MATRIPRGGSDDAPADETPDSSAPRTRAVRATRSASATNRLRRDAEEPVPAPETRAAKAVRASRANARAAAAAPAAGASRTVRIRPDSDSDSDVNSDDYDEEPALTAEGDDTAEPDVPAVVVLNGRRPTSDAPAPSSAEAESTVKPAGEATDRPTPPRRRAAPRPTSPPPVAAAEAPTAVPQAAPVPAAASPAAPVPAAAPVAPEKADKPKKERKPLPNVISIARYVGDKIGLLAQLAGLIAFLVLAIHVLFVASDANANNAIVSWFDRRSNGLVGDFRNIFSAKTAKGRVFYNYGLAAVVYLLAGSLVRRILRK